MNELRCGCLVEVDSGGIRFARQCEMVKVMLSQRHSHGESVPLGCLATHLMGGVEWTVSPHQIDQQADFDRWIDGELPPPPVAGPS